MTHYAQRFSPFSIHTLRKLTFTLVVIAALALFAPLGRAQTYNVIHTFSGGGDGFAPYSGLTIGPGGNLYGTTSEMTGGTVFQMKQVNGSWLLSTLLNFNRRNGLIPYGRPVFGPGGSLFGTTLEGGTSQNCEEGCGAVYNMRPPATVCKSVSCPWTGVAIYSFADSNDGGSPNQVNPAFDQAGNLYGTAAMGGLSGRGVVYKLTPSNGSWNETVILNFDGPNGMYPYSGVIIDDAGNLYGTTAYGGQHGLGSIYEISPSGSGWAMTTLYSFQGTTDGQNPSAGLVLDRAGNLYGATPVGGSNGGGTVFELSPSGGNWNFSLLYSLTGQPTQQHYPGVIDALAIDSTGNLYGAAYSEGTHSSGAIFKLTPSNGGWTYTSLHDFSGGSDGGFPLGGPSVDGGGKVYGTTEYGGTLSGQNCAFAGCGVVWEITP